MNKYMYESDYSSDSLRWLNKLSSKSNLNNPEELEKLQKEIIETGDSALAYFFAIEFAYKTYLMQKVVLDKKDAKYAFIFAQNVPNADVKALQNIVIDSKKIKYITKFACFVKQADRKQLESIIVKSKNVKYAHMFLKHVKGADASKFKTIIINSGKPRYLFELAKHLTSPDDISLIEDLIIEAKSFTYMRLMAEKIKRANVEKLEQAVLATDNGSEIKKFAKYVRKSKMKQFLLVM